MSANEKILADRRTVLDDKQVPRYTPAPADRSTPWDADRQRHLRSGETFRRLSNGSPVLYERVWTDPSNVEDSEETT